MKIWNLAIFVLLAAFCSCSNPLENKVKNNYGGKSRANSYENMGKLRFSTTENYLFTAKDSSGTSVPPLVIGNSDIVIAGSGGYLTLISNEELVWSVQIDKNVVPVAGMAADNNNNIYVLANNGYLYSFDKQGKRRWRTQAASPDTSGTNLFSDLLCLEDGIITASDRREITKIDFSGKVIWRKTSGFYPVQMFAGNDKNEIIIGLSQYDFTCNDSVAKYNPQGKLLWAKRFDNVRIIRSVICNGDNIVFAGFTDTPTRMGGSVYCLNVDGSTKWVAQTPFFPRFISADEAGNVYVAGYDAGVGNAITGIFSFDKNGKFRWKRYLNTTVSSPLIISKYYLGMTATTETGPAMYLLNKETGEMNKEISLTDFLPINLTPFVLPDGTIGFAGNSRLSISYLTDSPILKMLPF